MFVLTSTVDSHSANQMQRTKLIYLSAITWASRAEQALVFVSCLSLNAAEGLAERERRQLAGCVRGSWVLTRVSNPSTFCWILQAHISCSHFMFADRCSGGAPCSIMKLLNTLSHVLIPCMGGGDNGVLKRNSTEILSFFLLGEKLKIKLISNWMTRKINCLT